MVENATIAVSASLDDILHGLEITNYNLVCFMVLNGVLITAIIGCLLASLFKDWFK